MKPVRIARVTNKYDEKLLVRVQAYLPSNYGAAEVVVGWEERYVIIVGADVAGWTLDEYVIPRLASGCLWATEVTEGRYAND